MKDSTFPSLYSISHYITPGLEERWGWKEEDRNMPEACRDDLWVREREKSKLKRIKSKWTTFASSSPEASKEKRRIKKLTKQAEYNW